MQAAERAFKVGDAELSGRLVRHRRRRPGTTSRRASRTAIEPLGLDGGGLAAMPDVATHDVDLPRLAMFSTWGNTQEVGWVRHAFDTFEVPYDLIYKERIRKGNLRAAYDVILIPSQGRDGARAWSSTSSRTASRSPYTKSRQFPTLGVYGESDDITGGMGLEGVARAAEVRQGRRRADHARRRRAIMPAGVRPDAQRQRASGRSAQFYAPGPIVQAEILQADASDLLRLSRQDDAGALRATARCCRCRRPIATSRC